jgi:O-antigen ligase
VTCAEARLAGVVVLGAASSVSIFVAEAVLVAGFATLVLLAAFGREQFPQTSADTPILSLVVWTLLSASFALQPATAHEEAKKLLLFGVLYLAASQAGSEEARERILAGALLGGLALGSLMVIEAFWLGQADLAHRPRGFLGHYMTASGIVMVTLVGAAARLAFGRFERPAMRDSWPIAGVIIAAALVAGARAMGLVAEWPLRLGVAVVVVIAGCTAVQRRSAAALVTATAALVLLIGATAVLVSQTRSAWLGAIVGLGLVAVLRAPKLLWALAVGIVVIVAAGPGALRSRLTVSDASSIDRYFMWQAGLDMILERPVFGQGPGMVELNYAKFRWDGARNLYAPHLHNNIVQLAAERGVPALLLFAWWVGAVAVDAWRGLRAGHGKGWPGAVTIAALAAVLVAGLFEYNLGDSEVLMCVLLLCGLSWGANRARQPGDSCRSPGVTLPASDGTWRQRRAPGPEIE